MTEPPLYWIKQIRNTLIDAGAIPLSGFIPEFPWEASSEKLATLLHAPGLKAMPRKTQFLQGNELTAGLGASPLPLALELSPLIGQAFWVMAKEDVARLTTLALISSNGSKGFSTPRFQEGFYYYLVTEALSAIDELQAFADLGVKIGKTGTLPQEESLCIDVEIQHPKQTFWGRLICPASLHQAIKAHFSTPSEPHLSGRMAKEIDVTLRLEVGQTQLSLSECKKVRTGDCILLDRCTWDPGTQKGTAVVFLEQTPILRVRIKDHNVKILDYALYHEDQRPMSPFPPQDENNREESHAPEESSADSFEEETYEDEKHLWAVPTEDVGKMIATKEIPLTLGIEVARIRINLEKVLQLSPGNVLELPVKPETGVDIVVGGKKIGKGELVRVGEALGVKILQIGDHG